MKSIYEWICTLVFYMILMTAVMNMLPDSKYEKYLRLFSGTVFILLFLSPVSDIKGLDSRAAGIFEQLTFQNDAKLLVREIEDRDGKRMRTLIETFQKSVENEIQTMAEEMQVKCESIRVVLETDYEEERFGALLGVQVQVNHMDGNIRGLKKRIGEYYGLEEGKITVTFANQ